MTQFTSHKTGKDLLDCLELEAEVGGGSMITAHEIKLLADEHKRMRDELGDARQIVAAAEVTCQQLARGEPVSRTAGPLNAMITDFRFKYGGRNGV